MIIDIDGLEVFFPYAYMYPEQYQYMRAMKQTLEKDHGHCLLEMPTGTGKTVCLIALCTAFQLSKPVNSAPKLVYCTRTVQEMDKVIAELKRVVSYQINEMSLRKQHRRGILGVCLSARRNLCIHPEISQFENRDKVDAMCRDKTASWIRESPEQYDLCDFYEGYEANGSDADLEGVYALDDLKELGKTRRWCPYYLTRHLIAQANVVVYNYQYLIDPKIAGMVSREIESESIVVFDEGHNIDSICIEALSVTLNRRIINSANGNLRRLKTAVAEAESSDAQRLQQEYQRLVAGIRTPSDDAKENDQIQSAPLLAPDILREAVPGNIRRAKHFIMFMQTILQCLAQRLMERAVVQEDSVEFVHRMEREANLREFQTKALKFAYDRLQSLLRTLRITQLDEFSPLQTVTNFCTLVASYKSGFIVLMEPFHDRSPTISDPTLHLACLDAAIAMKPVLDKFKSVIITSGTMSPIDFFPKLLNFTPVISESLAMSLSHRRNICPLIVTKGNDQVEVSSKFEKRTDPAVLSNYGRLLVDLSSVVPDGIVCFFTSYAYMESVITAWNESGILKELLQHKLVFIETQDIVETSLALDSYKKACDCGRGGIFFSIARGKVAEGIDFDRHYGRCVVIFGIPYQYYLSKVLRARLKFLQETHGISENEFLTFDALRQASQCVGRVIRSKIDYGLMVFADLRYGRVDKYRKLPKWVTQHLEAANMNCSVDRAVSLAKDFLRRMGQPHSREDEVGVTLLNREQISAALMEGKL